MVQLNFDLRSMLMTVLILVVTSLSIAGLYYLWADVMAVLTPLAIGAFIAYLAYPLVGFIQSKGVPRVLSVLLVYLFLFGLLGIVLFFLIPALINDFTELADVIPDYTKIWTNLVKEWEGRYSKIEIPSTIQTSIDNNMVKLQELAISEAQKIVQFFIGLFSKLYIMVMAPVIGFYILKDAEQIKTWLKKTIPGKHHDNTKEIASRLHTVFGGWLRGQLLLSLIIAVLLYIGCKIIGLKYALVIALINAVTNLIPYFGPFIGAIPAVLLGATQGGPMIFKVLVLCLAIAQIEGGIVAPQIMSKNIGLHPLLVIFALLIGERFMGFGGMILALPLAAMSKILVEYYLENYRGVASVK